MTRSLKPSMEGTCLVYMERKGISVFEITNELKCGRKGRIKTGFYNVGFDTFNHNKIALIDQQKELRILKFFFDEDEIKIEILQEIEIFFQLERAKEIICSNVIVDKNGEFLVVSQNMFGNCSNLTVYQILGEECNLEFKVDLEMDKEELMDLSFLNFFEGVSEEKIIFFGVCNGGGPLVVFCYDKEEEGLEEMRELRMDMEEFGDIFQMKRMGGGRFRTVTGRNKVIEIKFNNFSQ